MKEFIFLLILTVPIFSETYNLEYILDKQKENTLIIINQKKNLMLAEEIKKKNYNEINFLLNTEKRKSSEEKESINFNLSYGDFYYNASKEIGKDKAVQSLGYSKNLNDLFYGENDYKNNNFEIEHEIQKINDLKTKNETNINIIKIYGNLVKIQEKVKLLNVYKENMILEKLNMTKKYESGDLSSIDYEAFILEQKSINIELENLKKEFEIARNELYIVSGIEIKDKDNLEFPKKIEMIDLENVGKNDLKILEYKKVQVKETSKFNKSKDKLQFNFKTDYTLDENNYSISLGISDKLKLKNYPKEKDLYDLEEIEFQIGEEKKKVSELRKKYALDYEKQVLSLNLDKEKLDLDKRNLSIQEKKYKIGELSYIEYQKEFEKFKEKEKNLLEKEIDLIIFLKSLEYL